MLSHYGTRLIVVFALAGWLLAAQLPAQPGQAAVQAEGQGQHAEHGQHTHGQEGAHHDHGATMPKAMMEHQGMMSKMMMKHLGTKDEHYDHRFIDLMISHHEQAIAVGQHALKNATKPELKELVKKMVESQQEEVKKMKQMRKQWYGQ